MLHAANAAFGWRFLLVVSALLGCTRESSPGSSASASAPVSASTSAASSTSASAAASVSAEPAVEGGRGDGSGGGEKAKRFGEPFAYVDGKAVGVMRYNELPLSLKAHDHTLLDGRKVPRYRVAEYLEAVGVKLADLKQLHLVGGRNRTAVVSGAEIRKHVKDLTFSFTRENAGKARIHWPGSGIEVESRTTIDVVVAMIAYVELEPPRFELKTRKFLAADGTPIKGIPFAKPEESLRGTRVYRDGKLLGSVKRKRLPDSTLSPRYDVTKPRFSLDSYFSWVGIKPEQVSALAVFQGDRVVARMSAKEWEKLRKEAEFSIAPGSEGRIILHLPKAGGETSQAASALMVFERAPVPKRIGTAPIEPDEDGSTVDQVPAEETAQ